MLKGGVSLVASRLVMTALPLVTIPWTLGYLGAERFGIWMAAASLIGILAIMEAGIANALITAISRASANEDNAEIRKLASSALAVLFPLAFVLIFIGLVIVPLVPWSSLFNVQNTTSVSEIPGILMVIITVTALNFIVNACIKLRVGLQQITQASIWETIGALASLPSMFAVIHFELGAPWLIAALLGVPLFIKALSIIAFFIKNKEYRVNFAEANKQSARELVRGSTVFLVGVMAYGVAIASDQILIAIFVSAEAVTPYTIIQRLFSIPFIFANLFFYAQWPVLARAVKRGELEWVGTVFLRTLGIAIAFTIILTSALVLLNKDILRLWVGDAVQPSPLLIVGMALYSILVVIVGACTTLLYSLDARREQIRLSLAMMVLNLPLTIILLHWIGSPGAIWATNAAYVGCMVIPYIFVIRRILFSLNVGGLHDDLRSSSTM